MLRSVNIAVQSRRFQNEKVEELTKKEQEEMHAMEIADKKATEKTKKIRTGALIALFAATIIMILCILLSNLK